MRRCFWLLSFILSTLALAVCGCSSYDSNSGKTLPQITVQPASAAVTVGQTATFSVTATGSGILTYQWQKNMTNISGATRPGYTTPATASGDNGTKFDVVVSDPTGSTTSVVATLTVNPTPPARFSRIVCL